MIRFKPKVEERIYSKAGDFSVKLCKRQVWYGKKTNNIWELSREEFSTYMTDEEVVKYFRVE